MKKLTIALTIAALTAFATTASAASLSSQQLQVSSALTGGMDLNVTAEKFSRSNLVITSRTPSDAVITQMRAAYKSGALLTDGFKVVGFARQAASGTWNFTLQKSGVNYIVNVASASSGSKLTVRGATFGPMVRRARTATHIRPTRRNGLTR